MTTTPHHPPEFLLVSPAAAGRSAAISIIQLSGDPRDIFDRLSIPPVTPGSTARRRLADIDSAVVACTPARDAVFLMPHAGAAVWRAVSNWLTSLGFAQASAPRSASPPLDQAPTTSHPHAAWAAFPEAGSAIEAQMLATLARAASPLAIDLLLDQPRRWHALNLHSFDDLTPLDPPTLAECRARAALLDRLVHPPVVVTLGPPNIGKSTLLNALARRAASIVADMPGTTRDHVGVQLDLAGLVVTYIDTPGLSDSHADPIDQAAQRVALDAAARADLVLLAADSTSSFVRWTPPPGSRPDQAVLRVALRADIGGAPPARADINVSALTGAGIERLVELIRETLVPSAALHHPGPWLCSPAAQY